MFRSALCRSLRATTCSLTRVVVTRSAALPQLSRASIVSRQSQFVSPVAFQAVRSYSAPAGLKKPEVEGRIVELLKNFDKVSDPTKINPDSHFTNDLGLDSLDTVEVVMAIEEEFSIEIPDKEADAIHSVNQAVDYILSQPDAH